MSWVNDITPRMQRHLVWLVSVLLLILMVYQLYRFVGFIFPNTGPAVVAPSIAVRPLPNIATLHLFGIYQADLALLPKTQLDLTLTGVVYSRRIRQSRALIAVPGQPPRWYRVAAALPGGARIEKITPAAVILKNNGVLQQLPIKRPQLHLSDD